MRHLLRTDLFVFDTILMELAFNSFHSPLSLSCLLHLWAQLNPTTYKIAHAHTQAAVLLLLSLYGTSTAKASSLSQMMGKDWQRLIKWY